MAEAAAPERQVRVNGCLIVYEDANWRIVQHQCGRSQSYTLWKHGYYGWRAVRFFFEEQGAADYIARRTLASGSAPGAPAQTPIPPRHQDVPGPPDRCQSGTPQPDCHAP